MIDRHLEAKLLQQRGNNRELAQEILEKLSPKNKERLYRIFQDIESDRNQLERKVKMPWMR